MVSRNQSTPLIGDLPQLRAFLVTKLNSFIKWDVVNFTQENSGVTDLSLARCTGQVNLVQPAVDKLPQAC